MNQIMHWASITYVCLHVFPFFGGLTLSFPLIA